MEKQVRKNIQSKTDKKSKKQVENESDSSDERVVLKKYERNANSIW